jgi:hypothetical protein
LSLTRFLPRAVRVTQSSLPGVVGHIRHDRLDEGGRSQVYWNYRQRAQDRMALVAPPAWTRRSRCVRNRAAAPATEKRGTNRPQKNTEAHRSLSVLICVLLWRTLRVLLWRTFCVFFCGLTRSATLESDRRGRPDARGSTQPASSLSSAQGSPPSASVGPSRLRRKEVREHFATQ